MGHKYMWSPLLVYLLIKRMDGKLFYPQALLSLLVLPGDSSMP